MKSAFVEAEHDSAYRGDIDGVSVWIDDGQRESGAYLVEVRLTLRLSDDEPPGNVRSTAVESTPVRESLRAFAASEPRIASVRVERDGLTLRLEPQTPAEDMEEIVRQAIALCRRPPSPYR
ncbi:MAG: hypothetical protein JST00_04580 [Deltaproteobacteria bacterium]|nr:hypothetical protein [Deltaproteobacteria bacterium]